MQDKVLRFNKNERIGHWVHTVSFVSLFLTGLVLFSVKLGSFLGVPGIQAARSLHRVMGIPFMVGAPIILLMGTPKTTMQWLKDVFTWDKDDFKFLGGFAKEFFGLHTDLPDQGKFNAGEKVNSLLTIFGCIVLSVTGVIMWQDHLFSPGLVQWMYPIHDLFALVMGGVIMGHAYLALGHPGSKESINGMISGYVSEEFAKGHHQKWYSEEFGKGNHAKKTS